MSFLRAVRTTLSPELGIDLGTANTLIYERDTGVLVSEPSVVAYDLSGGVERVIAVGRAAKEIEGRAPSRIRVVHPLRGGTISDFQAAHADRNDGDRASTARPNRAAHHRLRPGLRDRHRVQSDRGGGAAAGARTTTSYRKPSPQRSAPGSTLRPPAGNGRRHRRWDDRDRGSRALQALSRCTRQSRRRHSRRCDRASGCADDRFHDRRTTAEG